MTEFTITRESINVSSLDRPDLDWEYVDPVGHIHTYFYADRKTAALHHHYNPSESYSLPSLIWKVDGRSYYPDGSPYEYGHYECKYCGLPVEPRRKADDIEMYMPGACRYYIDGRLVSREEFVQSYNQANPDDPIKG